MPEVRDTCDEVMRLVAALQAVLDSGGMIRQDVHGYAAAYERYADTHIAKAKNGGILNLAEELLKNDAEE